MQVNINKLVKNCVPVIFVYVRQLYPIYFTFRALKSSILSTL